MHWSMGIVFIKVTNNLNYKALSQIFNTKVTKVLLLPLVPQGGPWNPP